MINKSHLLLFFALIVVLPIVNAQIEFDEILDNIEEWNIPQRYEDNYLFVDLLIYLLIFGGAFNATISERLGKAVVLGLTLAFTLAMVIFEHNAEFKVGDFYPLAIIMLVIVGVIYVYRRFVHGHNNMTQRTIIASIYSLLYIILKTSMPREAFDFSYDYPLINFFLQILLVVCLVYLGFRFFNHLRGRA